MSVAAPILTLRTSPRPIIPYSVVSPTPSHAAASLGRSEPRCVPSRIVGPRAHHNTRASARGTDNENLTFLDPLINGPRCHVEVLSRLFDGQRALIGAKHVILRTARPGRARRR